MAEQWRLGGHALCLNGARLHLRQPLPCRACAHAAVPAKASLPLQAAFPAGFFEEKESFDKALQVRSLLL